MNIKVDFIIGLIAIVSIVGFSLFCKFGLSLGGSSESVDASPDMHQETDNSHNKKFTDSVEKFSHNTTSHHYYTMIGSRIGIISLFLLSGGIVYYFRIWAKTNITLAQTQKCDT